MDQSKISVPTTTAEVDAHRKCNEMLYSAVTKNKKVQFLVDSIEALGCKIPSDFFICR